MLDDTKPCFLSFLGTELGSISQPPLQLRVTPLECGQNDVPLSILVPNNFLGKLPGWLASLVCQSGSLDSVESWDSRGISEPQDRVQVTWVSIWSRATTYPPPPRLSPIALSGARDIVFILYLFIYLFILSFTFLGPHPRPMEVPRPGVQLELWLLAYTTATATPDLSLVCNLHHSSRQCQIPNPLSETRYWTHNLMVPGQIRFRCATMGTPDIIFYYDKLLGCRDSLSSPLA